MSWDPAEPRERRTLAAVAALRFERTHRPETHNLYNEWDKLQAHWRELDRRCDMESFRRELAQENREKLSRILKLGRTVPEQLPQVVSMRTFEREKKFLLRFEWGVVWVRRHRLSLLEPLEYDCQGLCNKAKDPELARDLACAGALLAEFPRLR
jgi:hypothetical protein